MCLLQFCNSWKDRTWQNIVWMKLFPKRGPNESKFLPVSQFLWPVPTYPSQTIHFADHFHGINRGKTASDRSLIILIENNWDMQLLPLKTYCTQATQIAFDVRRSKRKVCLKKTSYIKIEINKNHQFLQLSKGLTTKRTACPSRPAARCRSKRSTTSWDGARWPSTERIVTPRLTWSHSEKHPSQ